MPRRAGLQQPRARANARSPTASPAARIAADFFGPLTGAAAPPALAGLDTRHATRATSINSATVRRQTVAELIEVARVPWRVSRHASGAPEKVRRRAAGMPHVRAPACPPQLARSTSGSTGALGRRERTFSGCRAPRVAVPGSARRLASATHVRAPKRRRKRLRTTSSRQQPPDSTHTRHGPRDMQSQNEAAGAARGACIERVPIRTCGPRRAHRRLPPPPPVAPNSALGVRARRAQRTPHTSIAMQVLSTGYLLFRHV